MTEFKSQLNLRLNNDANVSFSVTSFPDGDEQAAEAGALVADLVFAWCRGYDARMAELSPPEPF